MSNSSLNLRLGDYKGEPIEIYGGGFEKVNLITGMKGGGKSHIAKGIISENLKSGMSAVIFDINNEYDKVSENAIILKPGINLKFRIDFMEMETLFRLFERLAPFPEKTAYAASAKIPNLIREYEPNIPDIKYLRSIANQVVGSSTKSEAVNSMRLAYQRSLDIVESYNLIMTKEEADAEDKLIRKPTKIDREKVKVFSLRSVFNDMLNGVPQVLVFQIGGLRTQVQKVIVSLVLDHLKDSCDKQTEAYRKSPEPNSKQPLPTGFPIYPTVFFEEAHMYMESRDIDDLIPIIRHIGINVCFVTNTPGALPDSVFRLLDNLIMTRMVNRRDIDRVADCGLTDKETIVGFANNLKEHHALFLSAKDGATKNFPLVFHVRDFGLPKSGETRSQWKAMSLAKKKQKAGDNSVTDNKPGISDSQPSKSQ